MNNLLVKENSRLKGDLEILLSLASAFFHRFIVESGSLLHLINRFNYLSINESLRKSTIEICFITVYGWQ